MKIQIDHIVRDMTPEEEFAFLHPTPTEEEALTRCANSLTGKDDQTLIEAAETLITEKIKEE